MTPATIKTPPKDWLVDARVAGLEAFSGISPCSIASRLDSLAEQHVSVVEIDSELSDYLSETSFKRQLELLQMITEGAHQRGMRTVAYYPTLEVLTANADKVPHTMFRDHPEWVQTLFDGRPNTFIGPVVFWVPPGTESAWMCPVSGYAQYFQARVSALAETAVDGLWGDVPLFADLIGKWACTNEACQSKFHKDTGLKIPTLVDWNDPVFRQWVHWRHKVIWEFEQGLREAARKVRSDFEILIETVTMDYSGATLQGLDGAYADDGEVNRVWEVDVVSDGSAMREAMEIDWLSMAIMMKHGRACSTPRPSWVFCYGLEESDAEYVLSMAVATGNNPYESKIPFMNTTVGVAYRQRMFGWLERNSAIYRAESANPVAVLYSSTSRDVIDRSLGMGLYDTLDPSDGDWWGEKERDRARNLQYLSDYRGFGTLLIHGHVPFDALTTPHARPEILARYRTIIAPSLAAVSDSVASNLADYVSAGGVLLLTSTGLGLYDEKGISRSVSILQQKLGLPTLDGTWQSVKHGKGSVHAIGDRVGHDYYGDPQPSRRDAVLKLLPQTATPLSTNAPSPLLFELRQAGKLLYLLCLNLRGLGEQEEPRFTPHNLQTEVSLALAGKHVKKVTLSEPTAGKSERDVEAKFSEANGQLTLTLDVHALTLAKIEFA